MALPMAQPCALTRIGSLALAGISRRQLQARHSELAADLNISINTVKFHLRNLYDKLGLRNRSQAIAFYYANET